MSPSGITENGVEGVILSDHGGWTERSFLSLSKIIFYIKSFGLTETFYTIKRLVFIFKEVHSPIINETLICRLSYTPNSA